MTATGAVLATLRDAVLGAFPGAMAGSLIGAVLVPVLALWWFRRLGGDTADIPLDESPLDLGAAAPTMEV